MQNAAKFSQEANPGWKGACVTLLRIQLTIALDLLVARMVAAGKAEVGLGLEEIGPCPDEIAFRAASG